MDHKLLFFTIMRCLSLNNMNYMLRHSEHSYKLKLVQM